ncbi:MAG: S41 family peptidase [bacterium]|nr:S41 family peptidase [bacterium]
MKRFHLPLVRSLIACVFTCLLLVSCSSCTSRTPTEDNSRIDVDWFIVWADLHKDLTPESRLASDIVYELDAYYYAPHNLDYSDLFNAALAGVAEEMKAKNLSWQYTKIRDSAARYEARYEYAKQFVVAEKLAEQNKVPTYDLAFASAAKMLNSIGRSHTYFVYPDWHPKGRANVAIDESFVGIGVILSKIDEDFIYIAGVLKGGPAELAGLKPFDKIVSVDGKVPTGDLGALSSMIRGPEGTVVVIEVLREMDVAMKFTITRGAVRHSFAEAKVYQEGNYRLCYLEVRGFVRRPSMKDEPYKYVPDTDVFANRINFLAHDPGIFSAWHDGMIIDLRGNPGGSLDALVWFLSCFLPERTELFTLDSREGKEVRFSLWDPRTKVPVVILIDKDSGSAAEIFAGVMQETGRAKIVGSKSSGAVEVTSERSCFMGSSIHISEQQLYLPSGKCLEGVGVIPDYEVKTTKDDVLHGRDACIEKAKEILTGTKK